MEELETLPLEAELSAVNEVTMEDLIRQLGNATFENYVGLESGFSEMAYQMSAHVLTVGYAIMAAALLYFILTLRTALPRYQVSNVLSVVVTTSALLLLFLQQQNWTNALEFNTEIGRYVINPERPGDLFNNGYRYLNWLIDVPMLLYNILFVVPLTKLSFPSVRNQFWVSGVLMVITGYVGQFYEVTNPALYLIWGTISTIFFVHILLLMRRVVKEGAENAPTELSRRYISYIWPLFFASWMLYPGAYLMPYLLNLGGLAPALTETAVVARHITYTVADVTSKVIYGVLLTIAATEISKSQGYDWEKAQLGQPQTVA